MTRVQLSLLAPGRSSYRSSTPDRQSGSTGAIPVLRSKVEAVLPRQQGICLQSRSSGVQFSPPPPEFVLVLLRGKSAGLVSPRSAFQSPPPLRLHSSTG